MSETGEGFPGNALTSTRWQSKAIAIALGWKGRVLPRKVYWRCRFAVYRVNAYRRGDPFDHLTIQQIRQYKIGYFSAALLC